MLNGVTYSCVALPQTLKPRDHVPQVEVSAEFRV